MKTLAIINQQYPAFTKADKKISDFVIENFENLPSYTLKELSNLIGVGEATIIRYCKKLGYESLHEFRFDIVRDLENNKSTKENNFDDIQKIFEGTKLQIDNTYKLVNKEQIATIVEIVYSASNLYFYGIGHSGYVASIGAYRMTRYGKKAFAITDMHAQAINAMTFEENDLLFVISLSGQSPELIESVKIARKRGAYICVVVSHEHSELAKIANQTLISTTNRIFALPDGASVDGLITQLLLIESIIKEFSNLDKEEVRRRAEKITLSFAKDRPK